MSAQPLLAMNDRAAAYREKFTAPLPSPMPQPSSFWRNVIAVEYHVKPRTPLFEYVTAARTPDAPIRCRMSRRLDNGDLLVQFTRTQLERAIAHAYGIQP